MFLNEIFQPNNGNQIMVNVYIHFKQKNNHWVCK